MRLGSSFLLGVALLIQTCYSISPDPDASRTLQEIIADKGYPVDTQWVTTEDGYILTVFRVGHKGGTFGGPAVILQHGLLDSAFTWVVNEPNESLPYILSDAGFDVWLTNARGNVYALNHTSLPVNSSAFWNFSWDQIARFDLPALVEYVSNATRQPRIGYVGHSQGTTTMFAALITGRVLPSQLTVYVGLGPAARVGNERNAALRVLADLDIDDVFLLFGFQRFLPTPTTLHTLFFEVCLTCDFCCADVIELICGPHRGAFNDSRMDVVATHEPGGTSVRNMAHWAQLVRSGQYCMYDFGLAGNEAAYGSPTPPVYNLTQLPAALPYVMISGGLDELADPADVAWLLPQVPNLVYQQQLADYAHLDFVWDIEAAAQLYPTLVAYLQKGAAGGLARR